MPAVVELLGRVACEIGCNHGSQTTAILRLKPDASEKNKFSRAVKLKYIKSSDKVQ